MVRDKSPYFRTFNRQNAKGRPRQYLGYKPVEVGVGWALNVKGAAADVVDGLVVEQYGDISVLEEGVGGQDTVVWLNHRGRDLGGWVHSEPKLGLLAVINRQALQEEGAKARSRSSTNSVEDEEALETSAVVCKLPDAIKAQVNNLLANCKTNKSSLSKMFIIE
jgi:hypothetical protein